MTQHSKFSKCKAAFVRYVLRVYCVFAKRTIVSAEVCHQTNTTGAQEDTCRP